MNRLSNYLVIAHFRLGAQGSGIFGDPPGFIGRNASGNNQSGTSGGTFGVERSQPWKALRIFFQTRMHRTH